MEAAARTPEQAVAEVYWCATCRCAGDRCSVSAFTRGGIVPGGARLTYCLPHSQQLLALDVEMEYILSTRFGQPVAHQLGFACRWIEN
jgi:hypothetical protein